MNIHSGGGGWWGTVFDPLKRKQITGDAEQMLSEYVVTRVIYLRHIDKKTVTKISKMMFNIGERH